ncbi:MAG: hypothetical protein GDA46_03055 [Bdellovibrionales bacterium]|nr:hypothetical protein [Bdellovibrionales bacterium]
MDKYFFKIASTSKERALNLLDRNVHSKTFGCFDRYYWHFKTKDFPSSSYQMGVEYLARLWNDSYEENEFYKNPLVLKWIKASLKYTCSIQHKDGSFDEWYPNERGHAGPTSYVLHALIQAYQIVEKELEEPLKKEIYEVLLKSSSFLIRQKEGAKLTNHYVLFLLSLYEIYQIVSLEDIKLQFESHLKDFESFIDKEGWSIEYDSLDFGYNLATLSFLARLDKLYPHPLFSSYAKKSFYFLSYFFYPGGDFGALGSRNTCHLYPYAFKYWSERKSLSIAGEIYNYLKEKKAFEKLSPNSQDDHYLFYRLSEYLETDEIQSTQTYKKEGLPFTHKPFKKYFSSSGFFIQKSKDFYFVANMKKGACLRVYDVKKEKCLLKNNGWLLKSKNKLFTNCYYSDQRQIKIEDSQISTEGTSYILSEKYFNSLKFILFRLISLTVRHYKLAYFFKKIIRQLLITQKGKKGVFFKRTIYLKDQILIIEDCINKKKATKLFYGGNFSTRYVPQSNYFLQSDLCHSSLTLDLNKNKANITVRQKLISYKETKEELKYEDGEFFSLQE